jgi:hypothetical protein
MNEDGDLLVVGAEGFEFEKALTDLDKEIVVVVHLFDDLNDVGNELISDSIMPQNGSDDGDFTGGIQLESGVVALQLLYVNGAVLLLAIVEAHLNCLSCI